jgi:hypothetical protein
VREGGGREGERVCEWEREGGERSREGERERWIYSTGNNKFESYRSEIHLMSDIKIDTERKKWNKYKCENNPQIVSKYRNENIPLPGICRVLHYDRAPTGRFVRGVSKFVRHNQPN